MPTIHPTAIVDPRAELADDVEVGPGSIILGSVRIGGGTRLLANAIIHGPAEIGENNTLYPFVCLGYAAQSRGYDPREDGAGIRIGDENVFRESVTVHRATGEHPTTIGSKNYWMVNSHAGHDAIVEDNCTFANGSLLAGHVHIASGVTLGGNGGVHQFCRVGRLAMISGTESSTADLPPFCVMYQRNCVRSLNIVGLRRAGYRDHIKPLKQAYDIFFKSGHTNPVAVEKIQTQLGDDALCMEFVEFIKTSKRPICTDPGDGRDD